MYKVFVNDKPIILTTSLKKEENFPTFTFKNIVLEDFITELSQNDLKGAYLYSTDLENDWQKFKKIYQPVVAGGGLVINDRNEILFIYRWNKWDLPKGRVEEGEAIDEASIREVEEECGIKNVSIKSFLTYTFHLYVEDGINKMKETHWYLMASNYQGKLTPQEEEDITEVCFKNEAAATKALQNTYANIKLVYDCYLHVVKNDTMSL